MTVQARTMPTAHRVVPAPDIVDAEFEHVGQAMPRFATRPSTQYRPMDAVERASERLAEPAERFFARATTPLPVKAGPDRIAFYAIGGLLVAFTFWWTGGYAIMAGSDRPALPDMTTTGPSAPADFVARAETPARLAAHDDTAYDAIVTGSVKAVTEPAPAGGRPALTSRGSFIVVGAPDGAGGE